MQYRLVIFDLDGTILYTLEDLKDSVNYALKCHGYSERTIDEVRSFVGNGIRKLIERAVPSGIDESKIVEVHKSFTEYYEKHCADKTRPYEGIENVIKRVKDKGGLTAVVSNKADYGVQQLCSSYFDGLFDVAVGERDGVRRKPYPDAVFEVLKKLNIDKSEAVYVGDSEVDLQTAHNAGLNCISVEWGFRDRECLVENGATVIVATMQELIEELDV